MKLLDRFYFVLSVVVVVSWNYEQPETTFLNVGISYILASNVIRSYYSLDAKE